MIIYYLERKYSLSFAAAINSVLFFISFHVTNVLLFMTDGKSSSIVLDLANSVKKKYL